MIFWWYVSWFLKFDEYEWGLRLAQFSRGLQTLCTHMTVCIVFASNHFSMFFHFNKRFVNLKIIMIRASEWHVLKLRQQYYLASKIFPIAIIILWIWNLFALPKSLALWLSCPLTHLKTDEKSMKIPREIYFPNKAEFAFFHTGRGVTRQISRIILHPDYEEKSKNNDIALLELEKPVQFTKYIRPICIHKSSGYPERWAKCFVSGWGRVINEFGPTANRLKELEVRANWWLSISWNH